MKRNKPSGESQNKRQESAFRVPSHLTEEHPISNAKVAAILPAYNEAGRIGHLLSVLRDVSPIHEIIVVDDGSQDATAEQACQAAHLDTRIRVLRHEHNQGKGAAMFNGCRQTRAAVVLFLDSDLIGLRPSQVEDLIRPVASGQADMSIGVFKHGSFVTDISQRVTPWLSGQRCMRRYLLNRVSRPAAAGYGVETAITIAARQDRWRVVHVPLNGVSHPTGEIHRGLLRGAANRLRMYTNILQAAWLAGGPNFQLARLTPRIRWLSLLLTLIFAVSLAFNQAQALAPIRLQDLVSINLEGVFRVLVVDQDTASIPDLLTAESNNQKLLDLPELDFSPLKLPHLDLPILDELPDRPVRPKLIQGVALSLDKVQLDRPNNLLKIRLTGDPDPDVLYTLVLVTSTGTSQEYRFNLKGMGKSQKPAVTVIDLNAFEDPFLIGIALDAELGDETQRSGWTVILFPEWVPTIHSVK